MGWGRLDDLDGGPGDLVVFGFNGTAYMLDLGEVNRDKLATMLQPFIEVAKAYSSMPDAPVEWSPPEGGTLNPPAPGPVATSTGNGKRPNGRSAATTRTSSGRSSRQIPAATNNGSTRRRPSKAARERMERNEEIRRWASLNGYSVSATGRIPNAVLEAYDSAP